MEGLQLPKPGGFGEMAQGRSQQAIAAYGGLQPDQKTEIIKPSKTAGGFVGSAGGGAAAGASVGGYYGAAIGGVIGGLAYLLS